MAHSYGGYTANLPLEGIVDGQAWIEYQYDGAELDPEHGVRPPPPGARPLFLEERQMGTEGGHAKKRGQSRLLGRIRLQPARRSVARGTLRVTRPSTGWHTGSLARAHPLTASARSITLAVPNWRATMQHSALTLDSLHQTDIKLSAHTPSPALAPEKKSNSPSIDCPTVTVSPFLVDDLELGDTVELRGPLGGWFVWRPGTDPAHPADRRGLRCRSSSRRDDRAHAPASAAPCRCSCSIRSAHLRTRS